MVSILTSRVSADYEPTDHLVVSEVSPTSSPGEWCEIYNPTNQDISLAGCWIDAYANDYYFSSSAVIKAHGYFLVVGPQFTDNGKNSFAILKGPGGTIDGVGWGGSTVWKEGSAAPAPGYNHSLERKSGPTHEEGMGNGYDTNNNANDFFVCDSPNPQDSSSPIEPPFVWVSISPDENGGLPETVVIYTVVVKNERLFEDTFDLEASDSEGWDFALDDNLLLVGGGEIENTTLRVTIPALAEPGAEDIITVTATSRIMEDTNSDSCIVTAYGLLGVEVSISPSSQTGMPGLDRNYSVEVRNWGITTDTYTITASDELGWGLELENNSLTIDPRGDVDVTSLWVSIPENTLDHVEDLITVTATSQTDNTVSDSDTCTHVCVYEPIKYWARPTDDQVVMEGMGNLSGSYYKKLPCGRYCGNAFPGVWPRERSFLMFDLSSIPTGAYVENAYLGLYHHYGVYESGRWMWVEVWTVENDDWTETGIDWSNQPPKVENLYHEYIDYTSYSPNPWLGTIHGWPGVPVKSYIQSQVENENDGVASFVLYSPQEDLPIEENTDVDFASKDDPEYPSEWPYLEVWYYPCQLPPWPDVRIDRGTQAGWLGERLDYPVTITNLGKSDDNYDLTVSDTEGWGLKLSENLLIGVSPDESRAVTLSVTIPMDAEPSTIDTITVTATSQGDNRMSDSAEAIAAAPGGWVVVSDSLTIKAYGVGVVGAGENIYIINSDTLQNRYFMCYNTAADGWKYLATPPDNVKNAVAMAWDRGNYIYVLNGASYGTDAFFFYRYDIGGGSWERLQDTPYTQGAGDAMCWVPGSALGVSDDNYLYAIVGSGDEGSNLSKFYRYSVKNSSWSSELNFLWGSTDDGCSLVWAGGSYLYALRGEWQDSGPACYDFARYDLINNSWTSMAPIPADPHDGGLGGVGDGGSLLWIGGDYGDYIYALSGNQCKPEPIYDNRFYRYTISTNNWERLADLPAGVGDHNGPRLGFASGSAGKIYCWRGCKGDPVLWMYCPMGSVSRGVEISVSPDYQENLPGGTLEYTVTVTNTGNAQDTYDLTAGDNEGWGLSIASSITVPAFENRTMTLTVTIPDNATGCTEDNITVTATSQTDNTVSDSASCIAHAIPIVRSVEVSISPENQENVPSGTLEYEVTVTNTGTVPDTYDLSASDNEGWGPILDNGSLSIPVGESRTTALTAWIPEDAVPCTRDNITVTATSQTENTVENSASCIAHAIPFVRDVEVSISPDYQENLSGGTLKYAVTVTNRGNISDTYDLSVNDTENWASWGERRPITISGAHPENYQIRIVIPYDSDMRADYGDLRFYEDPGVGELPYWIESYTADNATVWVRREENSDNTIYVYYGNALMESAENAQETFIHYFDGNDYSNWTPGTNHMVENSDGSLHLRSSTETFNQPEYNEYCHRGFSDLTYNTAVEFKLKGVNISDYQICRLILADESFENRLAQISYPWQNTKIEYWDGTNWYSLWGSMTSGTYYRFRITIRLDENKYGVSVWDWENGQLLGENTSIPFPRGSPDSFNHIHTGDGKASGWSWAKCDENITWIFIRKYAFPEPTAIVGAEESASVFILPSGPLSPGENTTVTLTAWIPENAVPCTRDNITVTATSQTENTVENSASCIAHAVPIVRGVEVSISPEHQESRPGGSVEFTVTVKNTGNVWDNYNLTPSDDASWALKLDNYYLEIPVNENRETKLTVTIPDNEDLVCTTDNIAVVATAVDNADVTGNETVTVHAVSAWTGTATFKLENLYAVTIDLDGDFGEGENLVAKFCTYGGGSYQDETIVCSENIPGHVTLLENISRPGNGYIQRVKLVLIDSGGNERLTLKIFETSRTILMGRLGDIDMYWPFASLEERTQLMGEFGDIDLLWPFAPLTFEDP